MGSRLNLSGLGGCEPIFYKNEQMKFWQGTNNDLQHSFIYQGYPFDVIEFHLQYGVWTEVMRPVAGDIDYHSVYIFPTKHYLNSSEDPGFTTFSHELRDIIRCIELTGEGVDLDFARIKIGPRHAEKDRTPWDGCPKAGEWSKETLTWRPRNNHKEFEPHKDEARQIIGRTIFKAQESYTMLSVSSGWPKPIFLDEKLSGWSRALCARTDGDPREDRPARILLNQNVCDQLESLITANEGESIQIGVVKFCIRKVLDVDHRIRMYSFSRPNLSFGDWAIVTTGQFD